MVYIQSYKGQTWLLPPNIEDMIPEDHVCYLIEKFVESLDFSQFDKKYDGAGHPAYHPQIILKLLIMGVIDRVRSSRRLARAARENIVYMYLTEKLAPDFRTISDFRKENAELVKEVFTHTVVLAKECGILDLNILSSDGTKIKANANNNRILSREELLFLFNFVEKELEEWAEQDKKEDEIFSELRGNDQIPEGSKKKIKKIVTEYVQKFKNKGDIFKKQLGTAIQKTYKELEQNNLEKISLTDPDSRYMKNKKGKIELSYNPQITVDKKGFIVANDVCQDATDEKQLQNQVLETEQNIGLFSQKVSWNFDNGYYSGENLHFLECKNIDGYIPDQQMAKTQKGKKQKRPYLQTLTYNEIDDIFLTPLGEKFVFFSQYYDKMKDKMRKVYILRKGGKVVRKIQTYPFQKQRQDMMKKMNTSGAKEIYKIRGQTVETVIGDVKENKGVVSFLTRSLRSVKTEFNLVCIAHNIQKMKLLFLVKEIM